MKLNGMIELSSSEMTRIDGGGWSKFKKWVTKNRDDIGKAAAVIAFIVGAYAD